MKKTIITLSTVALIGINLYSSTFSTAYKIKDFEKTLEQKCNISNYYDYMNETNEKFNGIFKGDLKCENANLTNQDLNTFQVLKQIDGNLNLSENFKLTNLKGLINIKKIKGNINLKNNINLETLYGLDNIKIVNGDLNLINNYSLQNLEHLNNITNIKKSFYFTKNNIVKNLKGLNNLIEIDENCILTNNKNLINLYGLDNLNVINGKLDLSGNYNLKNFNGIGNLLKINKGLILNNMSKLKTLKGLDNLVSLSGTLSLKNEKNMKIDLSQLDEVEDGNITNFNYQSNIIITKKIEPSNIICKNIKNGNLVIFNDFKDKKGNKNFQNKKSQIKLFCGLNVGEDCDDGNLETMNDIVGKDGICKGNKIF